MRSDVHSRFSDEFEMLKNIWLENDSLDFDDVVNTYGSKEYIEHYKTLVLESDELAAKGIIAG